MLWCNENPNYRFDLASVWCVKVRVHSSTNGCLKWRVGYINIYALRIATEYVYDHGWLFKRSFLCEIVVFMHHYLVRAVYKCIYEYYLIFKLRCLWHCGGTISMSDLQSLGVCMDWNIYLRGKNLIFQTGFGADSFECIIIWRHPLKVWINDWHALM